MQRTLVQKRSTQKWYHDKGAKPLSELEKGDEAYMQVSNKWLPVVVTYVIKTPCSYVVKRPDGRKYRRNRKHLRAKYQARNNHYNATKTQGETSQGGTEDGVVQNKDLQQATPTEEGTDVMCSQSTRYQKRCQPGRPKRTMKPPQRYTDYVKPGSQSDNIT